MTRRARERISPVWRREFRAQKGLAWHRCDMRRRRQATRLLGHANPRLVLALIGVELVQAVLPLGVIAVIGVLVGRVVEGGGIAVPLAGMSALLLVQQLVAPLRAAVQWSVIREVDGEVRSRAMEAACRPAGIASLEDSVTLDLLALAGGNIDKHWDATPGGAAAAFVALGARYVQLAGAALVLAQVSVPVAAGLLALVIPSFVLCRRWAGLRIQVHRDTLGVGRASRYTAGIANAPPYAKEARLFSLVGWIHDRYGGQWAQISTPRRAVSRTTVRRTVTLLVGVSPLVALVCVAVGRAGLDGDLGPQGLAVAFQAALLLLAILDPRGEETYQLDFGLAAHDALVEVERRIAAMSPLGRTRSGPSATGLPSRAISLSGVSFSYGGATKVLDRLDLTIPAGTSVAIVGVNGAGKTTLVKLLAGLYEPEAGEITVDGITLDELDLQSWRSQLAVIFQDFVRYELSAADNVASAARAWPGTATHSIASPRAPASRISCRASPAVGTRRWHASTRAGPTCQVGSGSGSPWPGRSTRSRPAPAFSFWTSRQPTSTSGLRPSSSATSSSSRRA